jgi:hypothetical protein
VIKANNFVITVHAMTRWNERFSGSFEDALEKSFPYGVQKGSSTYYLNEAIDAVFVVKENTVITVLTKMQAVANIQMNGIQFATVQSYDCPEQLPKQADEQLRRKTESHVDLKINELFGSIRKCTDHALAELAEGHRYRHVIEHALRLRKRDANRLVELQKATMAKNFLLQIIKDELGKERRREVVAMLQEELGLSTPVIDSD